MPELVITREELKRHKLYFEEYAVKNLEQLKSEINQKRGLPQSRRQIKFLSLCLYYKKQLAIGRPEQLRKIQRVIDSHYSDLLQKDKTFRESVDKAFGYDAFSQSTIGEQLLEEVKRELKLARVSLRNPLFLDTLRNKLYACDRQLGDAFDRRVKAFPGKLTAAQLMRLLQEILIPTIKRGLLAVECFPEWNAYLLQYHRKVRTCPYCHRQYITPMYSADKKVRADMDHFYPRSRYPHFSMSIYNLIPCCKFCNSSLKGKQEFALTDKSPYEVSLNEMGGFQYQPASVPKIRLQAKTPDLKTYAEMFQLEMLYDSHENIADEIYKQSQRYSRQWVEDFLRDQAAGTPPVKTTAQLTRKELYQFILGKVSTEKDILKEPLNKLKRDLIQNIFGEDVLKMIEE